MRIKAKTFLLVLPSTDRGELGSFRNDETGGGAEEHNDWDQLMSTLSLRIESLVCQKKCKQSKKFWILKINFKTQIYSFVEEKKTNGIFFWNFIDSMKNKGVI